jgi:hypothetical protein
MALYYFWSPNGENVLKRTFLTLVERSYQNKALFNCLFDVTLLPSSLMVTNATYYLKPMQDLQLRSYFHSISFYLQPNAIKVFILQYEVIMFEFVFEEGFVFVLLYVCHMLTCTSILKVFFNSFYDINHPL